MKNEPHSWVKSTVGHGETQCSNCRITNREAAAIGSTDCVVLSWVEKASVAQSKWFRGYTERQFQRASK